MWRVLPISPLQSDSVLPECSTTLKRLESPSVSPLRTGLSLVVVERAQAEPPPPPPIGLCWRLHRLLSRLESNLEVEPGIINTEKDMKRKEKHKKTKWMMDKNVT